MPLKMRIECRTHGNAPVVPAGQETTSSSRRYPRELGELRRSTDRASTSSSDRPVWYRS